MKVPLVLLEDIPRASLAWKLLFLLIIFRPLILPHVNLFQAPSVAFFTGHSFPTSNAPALFFPHTLPGCQARITVTGRCLPCGQVQAARCCRNRPLPPSPGSTACLSPPASALLLFPAVNSLRFSSPHLFQFC